MCILLSGHQSKGRFGRIYVHTGAVHVYVCILFTLIVSHDYECMELTIHWRLRTVKWRGHWENVALCLPIASRDFETQLGRNENQKRCCAVQQINWGNYTLHNSK